MQSREEDQNFIQKSKTKPEPVQYYPLWWQAEGGGFERSVAEKSRSDFGESDF
jgi:hypothetical protein